MTLRLEKNIPSSMKNNLRCSSCDEPRYELKIRKSRLISSQTFYACNTCSTKRFEPRWIVIMAARRYGAEYVSDYLRPKRYVGEEIMLSEIA